MARSHGKILVDIWIDPDWIALDATAQWAYMMLLSQPQLTLVGSIDYKPHRWAQLAHGLTESDVEEAMARLEAARFVCIDRISRELLVRSMTRHDGLRTNNSKLLKGLWGQWKGIASAGLRKVAVDNMPDVHFGTDDTPAAAEHLRRSDRTDWPIPIGQSANQPNARTALLPPSTIRQPPSADAQSVAQADPPVDNGKLPDDVIENGLAQVAKLKDQLVHTPAAPDDHAEEPHTP